jgi:hypothetical protein
MPFGSTPQHGQAETPMSAKSSHSMPLLSAEPCTETGSPQGTAFRESPHQQALRIPARNVAAFRSDPVYVDHRRAGIDVAMRIADVLDEGVGA